MFAMLLTVALGAGLEKPFAIRVVDEQTGRGVPLVELKTVFDTSHFTDSQGYVAFNEPGLMNENVFFSVTSHGYEFEKDGFGFKGKALKVTPGGSAELKIKRKNIAERLYRVTGAGIYRDSQILGKEIPIKQPTLNALVSGSDSVVNQIYRGKIFWIWGDTNTPSYPLGNFNVPGATSEIPGKGGLDPKNGVDLSYFTDKSRFAKPLAKMPGEGPTWIETLVTMNDEKGEERLYASFIKVKSPLTVYARGLAIFDDQKQEFQKIQDVDLKAPVYLRGHSGRYRDGDREYVYFSTPYPYTRVTADVASLKDPQVWENYTCLKEGSTLEKPVIDRDEKGKARYRWRKNAPLVDWNAQNKLIKEGKLKKEEAGLQLRDRDTGKAIYAHAGSVYWNEYRKKWIMITVESHGGPSFLGEVWYSEADQLVGPWLHAVKILTHDRKSFYNPKQHPMFDQDGGRTIYFEGTYTESFSGNPDKTPYYEYNQMMYRLDLSDKRLLVPSSQRSRTDN